MKLRPPVFCHDMRGVTDLVTLPVAAEKANLPMASLMAMVREGAIASVVRDGVRVVSLADAFVMAAEPMCSFRSDRIKQRRALAET